MATGRLIVISGPSGAGKSTVVRQLIQQCSLPLQLSVSATTRPPRPGETHGAEYYFLSEQEFALKRQQQAFLECKEVFGLGTWYGTLKEPVATGLNAGKWVVLEIDVQGAMTVFDQNDFDPISIFIHPGSAAELEQRLRGRGTESESAIQARLKTADREMQSMHRYQYKVINDSVDRAVATICEILNNELKEKRRC